MHQDELMIPPPMLLIAHQMRMEGAIGISLVSVGDSH